MRLAGKNALITGGGKGLGATMSRMLAGEGARIIVADIDMEAAESVASDIAQQGGHAMAVALDVTQEDAWESAFAKAEEELGALDILINNAGIAALGTAEDTTLEDWRRVMAVNLEGVFLGTRIAIRRMKTRGGSIINISSIKGLVADTFTAAYDASKAGVRLFSKSAALHCASSGYGIRVNTVHPSYIMTDMVRDAAATVPDPDGFLAAVVAKHPMGHLCEPEDVANAVLFLASDESRYINGSEIVVDGGYTAQ